MHFLKPVRIGDTLAVTATVVSKDEAKEHVESPVAGDADILAVPDLESGNMLAKQLGYMGGATVSGLVLGARVPIALTSRADAPMARVASSLLALLVAHNARRDQPRQAWPKEA